MRSYLTKTVLPIIGLILISNCVLLDPNYYIWKDSKVTRDDFLPWSGINEQPKRQFRKYTKAFYTEEHMRYRTEYRWKISLFDKRNNDEFADEIGEYLVKNNILQKWGFHKYRGSIYGATPPYDMTFVSIEPLIVVMGYYTDEDLKNNLKYPTHHNYGFTVSDYSHRAFKYGTTIKYQDNLKFFSPDLDILPQPLNLKKNGSVTIHWNRLFNSGAIVFTEKGGVVQTKRIENKEGKDFKKDGLYNPKYHLNLIKH